MRVILALLLLALPLNVFAAGTVFNMNSGNLEVPSRFTSFLRYENGSQGMVVSVELSNTDDDMLWVLPVPPSVDYADVSEGRIHLSGSDVFLRGGEGLEDVRYKLFHSQLWPFLIPEKEPDEAEVMPPSPREEVEDRIVTYDEYLGEEGMDVSIVSNDDLMAHLESLSVTVSQEDISVFDSYVQEGYSFVVSEMEAPDPLEEEGMTRGNIQRGVVVSFATEEPSYPLMSLKAYKESVIPVTLQVAGFFSPSTDEAQVRYSYADRVVMQDGHREVLGDLHDVYGFTQLNIRESSSIMDQDLRMSTDVPFNVWMQDSLHKYSLIIFLIIFPVLSVLSGVIVGVTLTKEGRGFAGMKKWGMVGLYNCLSLAGLAARMFSVNMKHAKYLKPLFVALYSAVFILLSFSVFELMIRLL